MHPHDFGDPEVARATIERLFERISLSEVDRDIIYLRFGLGWFYKDIAKHVGEKYFGRTDANPMWEGTIRHRTRKLMKTLRQVARNRDF